MGDITERKQAETKLKLVRALLDNSNDAIEVLDPVTLRFLDINATGCLALGYTREELLSMSIYDIIDTAYSAAPQKVLAQLRESEHALFETIHRRKDGSTFPVEVNVVSVELDKPYLLAITRDITERKLLEAAQQDSARRLQRIIDFSVLLSPAPMKPSPRWRTKQICCDPSANWPSIMPICGWRGLASPIAMAGFKCLPPPGRWAIWRGYVYPRPQNFQRDKDQQACPGAIKNWFTMRHSPKTLA